MGQCVVCKDFLPPNYLESIENAEPVNGELPKKCVFCKIGKNSVERIESANNPEKYVKYTKKQCVKDYKEFLNKLKDSANVKDILKKSKDKFFI